MNHLYRKLDFALYCIHFRFGYILGTNLILAKNFHSNVIRNQLMGGHQI